ncbi:MAG: hypothetical protein WCO23_00985 [bacterium]
MKVTNIYQKLLPSVINVLVVFVFLLPLRWVNFPIWEKGIVAVIIFFAYTLIFLIFNRNRDLGMIVVGTYWKEKYPVWQHLIFNILYTASFATLIIWIWFPFDLFLTNMILLQLPSVLLTGTTFHGLLSGKMVTVFDKAN